MDNIYDNTYDLWGLRVKIIITCLGDEGRVDLYSACVCVCVCVHVYVYIYIDLFFTGKC